MLHLLHKNFLYNYRPLSSTRSYSWVKWKMYCERNCPRFETARSLRTQNLLCLTCCCATTFHEYLKYITWILRLQNNASCFAYVMYTIEHPSWLYRQLISYILKIVSNLQLNNIADHYNWNVLGIVLDKFMFQSTGTCPWRHVLAPNPGFWIKIIWVTLYMF